MKEINKNFKFLKTLRVSTYIFIYQNFIFRQFVPLKVPSPTPLFVQIIMDRLPTLSKWLPIYYRFKGASLLRFFLFIPIVMVELTVTEIIC